MIIKNNYNNNNINNNNTTTTNNNPTTNGAKAKFCRQYILKKYIMKNMKLCQYQNTET